MTNWRDVQGFEGLYKVSNTGEVYSCKRDKLLKPKLDRYGYHVVCLYNGRNNYRTIHRLVAQAFLTPKEGCNIVNHLDCNKTNNNVDNLEWTTIQGNSKHAYENNKEYHDRTKNLWRLSVEKNRLKLDVYQNGKYIGSFNSKKETAEKLKISEKTIYNGLNNKYNSSKGYFFVKRGWSNACYKDRDK